MKKTTALTALLLASLASAQESTPQQTQRESLKGKGFFVGADIERIDADSEYKASKVIYRVEGEKDTYTEPAFKVGYQYYFTRIYFKYSQIDEETGDYTVESKLYEANLEYIPVVYRAKSYALRLITGVSIGYTDNELTDISQTMRAQLDAISANDTSDKQPLYGAQLGLMLEMSSGVSAEFGYRYRKGDLLDMEGTLGDVTIETTRKQWYLGVNYMF